MVSCGNWGVDAEGEAGKAEAGAMDEVDPRKWEEGIAVVVVLSATGRRAQSGWQRRQMVVGLGARKDGPRLARRE